MEIKSAEFVKGIRGTDELLESDVLQIAFYGRSNSGKSSSINSLLGRNNLVKSSSTPGKTKELNLFEVNETFYFIDLPGYGYAKMSEIDREKLRKLIKWYVLDCNVINRVNVLVLDSKVGLTDLDEEILETFWQRKEKIIILMNKSDKLKQKDLSKNFKKLKEKVYGRGDVIIFSAKSKKGVEKFWSHFSR